MLPSNPPLSGRSCVHCDDWAARISGVPKFQAARQRYVGGAVG
jgi:hypothetical protein